MSDKEQELAVVLRNAAPHLERGIWKNYTHAPYFITSHWSVINSDSEMHHFIVMTSVEHSSECETPATRHVQAPTHS
jgi:hypothetical protein